MSEIHRPAVARAGPRIGETHRVEVREILELGVDWIVTFRDLDRKQRTYTGTYTGWEREPIAPGRPGTLTRAESRTLRDGRWIFTPDGPEGMGDGQEESEESGSHDPQP